MWKGRTRDNKQMILFRQWNVLWILTIFMCFFINFNKLHFFKYYSFCVSYVPNIFKPLPPPATLTKTCGKISKTKVTQRGGSNLKTIYLKKDVSFLLPCFFLRDIFCYLIRLYFWLFVTLGLNQTAAFRKFRF